MKSIGTKSPLARMTGQETQPSAQLQDQICRRAHELYEQRGSGEGRALDSLQAESELVKENGKTAVNRNYAFDKPSRFSVVVPFDFHRGYAVPVHCARLQSCSNAN